MSRGDDVPRDFIAARYQMPPGFIACVRCVYFQRADSAEGEPGGRCRKDPPVLREVRQDSSRLSTYSGWPLVAAVDWCGSFLFNGDAEPERPLLAPKIRGDR